MKVLFPCPSGHVMAKGAWSLSGMLCGRWGPASLSMVGHALNLLAKHFPGLAMWLSGSVLTWHSILSLIFSTTIFSLASHTIEL